MNLTSAILVWGTIIFFLYYFLLKELLFRDLSRKIGAAIKDKDYSELEQLALVKDLTVVHYLELFVKTWLYGTLLAVGSALLYFGYIFILGDQY